MMTTREDAPIPVYLEIGRKRVFACALEWAGWCRSGKNEEQALDALTISAPRYALVAAEADLEFPQGGMFDVVERLAGSATTDFGAPGAVASGDAGPLLRSEVERLAALVGAAWVIFDRVVAVAPLGLRKGPRSGGRDRDAIAAHILAAETVYARKLGIHLKEPDRGDTAAIASVRRAVIDALHATADRNPVEHAWPPRSAARRIAWHVLDHAWEIEDRTESGAKGSPSFRRACCRGESAMV